MNAWSRNRSHQSGLTPPIYPLPSPPPPTLAVPPARCPQQLCREEVTSSKLRDALKSLRYGQAPPPPVFGILTGAGAAHSLLGVSSPTPRAVSSSAPLPLPPP